MNRDQFCNAASAVMSPLSIWARNVPLAVRPPFDEVNSVREMVFFESFTTYPAVSATARSVRASSNTVDEVEPTVLSAAPPYT